MSGTSVLRTGLGAAALAVSVTPSWASDAAAPHLNGAELGVMWAVPFIGILLSIAVLPLATPHFWHRNYGKISVLWSLAFLGPFAVFHGAELAAAEFAHVMLLDFVPFMILLLAPYTMSGGVLISGRIQGTPLLNTSILAGATAVAGLAGTTGASVLFIRPLLRANAGRKYNAHVVIFFIFLVSNLGGALTPLGPPLSMGFLKGVDFFWPTMNLWQPTLVVGAILLAVFFVLDTMLGGAKPDAKPASDWPDAAGVKVKGGLNIVLLLLVPAVILASAMWQTDIRLEIAGVDLSLPEIARNLALLLLAAISLMFTPLDNRTGNEFTWGPMTEVAKLFFGIFVTMVPILAMMRAGTEGAFAPLLALLTGADGQPNNAMYFWLTGGLSSFLDNAPTYLVFFNAAGGDPAQLMGALATTLAAISFGAVAMGANTYIGNAPNFMVKAIAEESGVKMPSFFGYMAWSTIILLPIFALVTWLFFR
ncbi:MAG: sodium:proton antiporter [Micropepsaceae bacterium]